MSTAPLACPQPALPARLDGPSLRSLIACFEAGALARSAWNHRAHLAVAAWYVATLDEPAALRRMRAGIEAYNRAHGIEQTPTTGYHHTITVFWLDCVRWVLEGFDGSRLQAVNLVLKVLGARRELILSYYSPEVLDSWRARVDWVEPDLASFP